MVNEGTTTLRRIPGRKNRTIGTELGSEQLQEPILGEKADPGAGVGMDKSFVVVPFDGDDGDLGRIKNLQDFLGLPEVARFDLGPIKQIAGQEENISPFRYGCLGHVAERQGEILVGEPAIESEPSQVDIGGVAKSHDWPALQPLRDPERSGTSPD